MYPAISETVTKFEKRMLKNYVGRYLDKMPEGTDLDKVFFYKKGDMQYGPIPIDSIPKRILDNIADKRFK